MNTLVVSATRKAHYSETLLYESLTPIQQLYGANKSLVFEFACSNTDGLSKVYNRYLDKYGSSFDCIIFAHDDLYIDDAFLIDKIRDGFDIGYDIVGVAGGLNPVIKAPTLWHIMCSRGDLRGAASHFTEDKGNVYVTSFGPCKSRVSLLDGLFLAVNTQRAREVGWRFNENYDFHLYDLASCLDANKLKLKMGVLPIHVVHESPGLRSLDDPCFVRNQAQFLKEYAS